MSILCQSILLDYFNNKLNQYFDMIHRPLKQCNIQCFVLILGISSKILKGCCEHYIMPCNKKWTPYRIKILVNFTLYAYLKGIHTYHTTSRRLTKSSTGWNPSSTSWSYTGNGIQPVEDYYLLHQIWVGAKIQFHFYW